MSIVFAFVALFLATASAQETVMQTGEVVGQVMIGGTCAPQSSSCLVFQNDNRSGYPVEIVSVSYVSTAGMIVIEAAPVIGAHLQCVLPNDGRPCAPVLMAGQMGAMVLPAPLAPGHLISIELRAWDPPGSEAGNPHRPFAISDMPVTLVGDPAAAMEVPALPVRVVSMLIGRISNYANWSKGK